MSNSKWKYLCSVGVVRLLQACTTREVEPTNTDSPKGGSEDSTADTGDDGDTAAAASDCTAAEQLPQRIEKDTTVGPGCVRMFQSTIVAPATLTLAPGTTVAVLKGGFLSVARDGDAAALNAVGTASSPVVFTSAAAVPAPGDWECIRLGGTGSKLQHVVVEYGGAPCEATGAGQIGMVTVAGDIVGLNDVTFQKSSGHGVYLDTGAPGSFANNTFRDNAKEGIRVKSSKLVSLGKPNTFADPDDTIFVEGELSTKAGTWTDQGVPYVIRQSLGFQGDMVVEAGVRVELVDATVDVFKFDIRGTAEAPVTFTSASPNPAPGDWGCMKFGFASTIEHAVFEYAGKGAGCTGGNTKTAIITPAETTISNTLFRDIDGAAITSGGCSDAVAGWCENSFEGLSAPELLCNSMPTDCP